MKTLEITRALIVAEPYASMLVDGLKHWEMRTKPTNIRGRIGIISKGTGTIIGEVDLVHSIKSPLPKRVGMEGINLNPFFKEHKIKDPTLLVKWKFPWTMENATRYKHPITYDHPQGAVIWVKV